MRTIQSIKDEIEGLKSSLAALYKTPNNLDKKWRGEVKKQKHKYPH